MRRRRQTLLLTFAALVGALLTLAGCGGEPTSRVELVTWQYRWGDSPRAADGRLVWLDASHEPQAWQTLSLPEMAPASSDEGIDNSYLWMRTEIPAGEWRAPALMVDPIVTLYEAYLDGELIDRVGDLDGRRDQWEGLPWRMVPLAPIQRPRTLVLRFRTTFWMAGIRGRAFVGEVAEHHRAIVRRDTLQLVLGAIAWLAGIFFLGLAARRASDRVTLASLGIYALGAGGYSIFYTKLKDLLVEGPVFWASIQTLSVQLAAIGIVMFVAHAFEPGPKQALRRLYHVQWGLLVVVHVLQFGFGTHSLLRLPILEAEVAALVLVRVLIFVATVLILYVVIRRARRGDRKARVMLWGVAPLAIFTLRDVLAAANVVTFDWSSYQPFGAVALLAAQTYIVQLRREEELRRFATEKQHMLRDLHDGIGGITSNIGLLAEVAVRAEDEARTRKLAGDIAELSREGMAEMRYLLDSLDERELSWDRLAGQLRHLGSQALGPHDIDFVFAPTIAPKAPPPSSAGYIHTVRIFREALANAIKHAEATRVEATLEVAVDGVRLEVRDDGLGFDEASMDKGRGLANIRDRAAKVGGEGRVRAHPDGGTVVELVAALPLTPPDDAINPR